MNVVHAACAAPQHQPKQVVKVLYLFAGIEREADLDAALRNEFLLHADHVDVEMENIDILRVWGGVRP